MMRAPVFLLACSAFLLAQGEPGSGKKKESRISCRFTREDVSKIIEVFAIYSKTTIDLDPLYAHRQIDIALDDATLEDALKKVAWNFGAKVGRRAAGGYRIVPPWKAVMFERIEHRKISIDHQAPLPIESILSAIGKLANAPFVFDPALKTNRTGELHVKEVTASQVLDLLTAPNELGWELRYGVVFVSTPARLKALPARASFASARLPDKSLKLAYVEAPLTGVLRHLQTAGGLPITVDKRAAKAVQAVKVTCDLEELSFRHALALMLLPHGFSAVVEEGTRIRVIPR
ncbi:MAG: hypothetical protein ACYSX0_06480 [Planctomycetota bacterium]|jgi:type II secretory pathway component GspD/PulD (secretin)